MATANNADEFNTMFAEKCEDFTDRSEWVHLPCKVGDRMYCDGKFYGDYCAGEIMDFSVDLIRTQVCKTLDENENIVDVLFDVKDFGKTVFLTREEAEKALERMKRNEDDN